MPRRPARGGSTCAGTSETGPGPVGGRPAHRSPRARRQDARRRRHGVRRSRGLAGGGGARPARLTLDRLGLEAGQTIAVTGAAGAYGGYVVELAKADGLRVRDGGGIASVRPFQADTERDITVHQIWVAEYAEARAELDRLRDLAEGGGLTMRIAQVYAADDAHEAHRRLEAGGTRGRLVIEL